MGTIALKNVLDGQYIDNLSNQSNPKCVSSCVDTIKIGDTIYKGYIDEITPSTGYATCVLSCKKLQPSAVIDKDGLKCVSACSFKLIHQWYRSTASSMHRWLLY